MPNTNVYSTSGGFKRTLSDTRQVTPMIMHNPLMTSSSNPESKPKVPPLTDYYEDVKRLAVKHMNDETLCHTTASTFRESEQKHGIFILK